MTKTEFSPFRGLIVNDFIFRGVDAHGGITFEHTCGYVVRFGSGATISSVTDEVRNHKCEVEHKIVGLVKNALTAKLERYLVRRKK